MDFLRVADAYRAMGLKPIPLQPKGKKPLLGWADYQTRQPTHGEISEWAEKWPDANVGLVMGGGTFALDLDGDLDACKQLLAEAGVDIPDGAPLQQTGKGHHILLHARDRAVPDRVAWLRGVDCQIDVRGVGYIAAAPSIHPSGAEYRWLVKPKANTPPPAATPETVDLIVGKTNQSGVETSLVVADNAWVSDLLRDGAPEGMRNQELARLAGYLFATLPGDVAEQVCLEWGRKVGLSDWETRQTCLSIERRELRKALPAIESAPASAAPAGNLSSIGEIAQAIALKIHKPTVMLATPWAQLNLILGGGFLYEEYVIIAARPSVGKTAMAINLASHVAKSGRRAFIGSLEMSKEALVGRVLAQEAGVDAARIRQGGLGGEEMDRVARAADRLTQYEIYVESAARDITSLAARVRETGPWDVVIVDYIQKLRPAANDANDARRLEIDAISYELNAMAKLLHVPVVAISALARSQKNERPTLSSLKESSGLEYDADIVMLLHREDLQSRTLDVEVAKSRNTGLGRFSLDYDGSRFAFTDTAAALMGKKEDDRALPF
jgi:hypothetical protein